MVSALSNGNDKEIMHAFLRGVLKELSLPETLDFMEARSLVQSTMEQHGINPVEI